MFLEVSLLGEGQCTTLIGARKGLLSRVDAQMVEELVRVTHCESAYLIRVWVGVTALEQAILLFHILVLLEAVVFVLAACWDLVGVQFVQQPELLSTEDLNEVHWFDLGVFGDKCTA